MDTSRKRFGCLKSSLVVFDVRFCLLLLTLLLADIVNESEARLSGLYVDNGLDQTVIHRVVSQRERREVEHEILNLLGLPDRPRGIAGHPPQVKRSAPKFLLDIYRNTLGEGEEQITDNIHYHHSSTTNSFNSSIDQDKNHDKFDLSGQDLRAIDQSDVIMSFAAHSK